MKTYNGETLVLSRNRMILISWSFPLAHYFAIGFQKVKNPGPEVYALISPEKVVFALKKPME